MANWRSSLTADPTGWLLESSEPAVRYFTLRDILDRPEDDSELIAAGQLIMKDKIITEMLEKQRESEYIAAYPRFYTYKYKGLVWSLITLAELGTELTPQIEEQCEYLLENSQEKQDGGFSQNTAKKLGGGRITEVIPCLTGNMVWSLIHFGYLNDPRLQRAIDWLTGFMCFNDGVEVEPQVDPYDRIDMCWGAHTCHMGVIKALKGLSAIPVDSRSQAVIDTIERAVEFMLTHHIYKRSHDLSKKSKPGWLRIGFPNMYQTDILEILDILTSLGIRDSRMDDAVKIIIGKQDEDGRWSIENTYCSEKLLVPIGQKGEQSKWLTLKALRVLKRYYQSAEETT